MLNSPIAPLKEPFATLASCQLTLHIFQGSKPHKCRHSDAVLLLITRQSFSKCVEIRLGPVIWLEKIICDVKRSEVPIKFPKYRKMGTVHRDEYSNHSAFLYAHRKAKLSVPFSFLHSAWCKEHKRHHLTASYTYRPEGSVGLQCCWEGR